MTAAFVSFSGGYIPSTSTNSEVTANLVINYARNIKSFKLLQYSSVTPVKKPIGFYTRISNAQAQRVNPTTGLGFNWAPGQMMPDGSWNKLGIERIGYTTFQYAFPVNLPLQTIETADFKIEPAHFAMMSQQAMVNRTLQIATVGTTSGNYASSHVSTATALTGGYLDAGNTTTNPYIQRMVQKVAQQIGKDSNGMITSTKQLNIICNPNSAALLSQSDEVRNYLAQQLKSIEFIKGEGQTNPENWNLPDKLYGADLIIEDASYNDGPITAANDTSNNKYCWPDQYILIAAKPKDLIWPDGAAGNPSTLGVFEYEAMNAVSMTDTWNRLLRMAVIEQFQAQVISPLTGYLVTNCFTP